MIDNSDDYHMFRALLTIDKWPDLRRSQLSDLVSDFNTAYRRVTQGMNQDQILTREDVFRANRIRDRASRVKQKNLTK